MKKIVLAVAIAMAGAWGIFQANNNNNLSELQMENVEALARSGEVTVPYICYNTFPICNWNTGDYLLDGEMHY